MVSLQRGLRLFTYKHIIIYTERSWWYKQLLPLLWESQWKQCDCDLEMKNFPQKPSSHQFKLPLKPSRTPLVSTCGDSELPPLRLFTLKSLSDASSYLILHSSFEDCFPLFLFLSASFVFTSIKFCVIFYALEWETDFLIHCHCKATASCHWCKYGNNLHFNTWIRQDNSSWLSSRYSIQFSGGIPPKCQYGT